MDNGIWKIATAKLCERCGENRIVHAVQYTMNKRGLEKRGKLNGPDE
nr:MAG TPA: hypothetical protein [Caudoviricetes sp.]